MIDFNIIQAKSKNCLFEFNNHTTSSVIQLVIHEDGQIIYFDYSEFEEFANFIEELKNIK